VNLEDEGHPKPEVAALLTANEGAKAYHDGGLFVACPATEKKPVENKPPIKAMLWRIRELGGGFQSPESRPDYCIESYAEIVKVVKADVVIILGLASTTGWTPKNEGNVVRIEEGVRDTGISEAKRILSALGKTDAGGGWKLVVVSGPDGKPAYFHHQTACFFYKGGSGITCGKTIVAACGPAFLGVAPVKIPATFDCPPDLSLFAPLAVGQRVFFAKEPPDPKVTGTMPANGIVSFSSPEGLGGNEEYADLRTECDVEYAPPLREGTRLKIPYWEVVSERTEALLENFTAINAADVIRQDKSMHWEAIEHEKHPASLEKVVGRLADALMVRHTSDAPAPRLEKARVVDLVRAALDTGVLAAAGTGDGLAEDSSLAAVRKKHTRTAAHVKSAAAEAQVENQIAEAVLFARKLSDHWPVIADVHLAE